MFNVILDTHQRSLIEILHEQCGTNENKITVTLAEHLLKLLAPGQSYVTHNRMEKCACTSCKKSSPPQDDPPSGRTGIGMNYFKYNILAYYFFHLIVFKEKNELRVFVLDHRFKKVGSFY